ncbi:MULTISPECIES: class I SAM-dependent methyltransferase [unclassified Tolypothrix]|uniref:class I SAM-dependent methyltransferase n=1 Tax=unclassified Tolypothrix TaxID=2649714 RepID=UPI0005EAC2FD|nr:MULTISPECIES: class I SAM-dependent methyltransferase [unclassified Tolypothrix]BAY94208.1 UbiE/COQ5 methyltransferase [Microchaete diplosiphon NIES-3275]EKF03870.1 UbiE family methyltransferase [Tolypothrix sp. PCC 7601]MBE9085958.1 class I SAM-dependent methyltransferase [Tolypothrix sp. LEGE 11397]UYD27956.1 class I SAM-dependent methyltransferase [Tolypothrix sp. PCC 7712]UYD36174.1 class I SAM-dependent methyltransferase [Tolypothrix sp. PCC 7601]
MATILRDWSYRYQWLYDGISGLAALSVGGESRFRQLALQGLTISSDSKSLDLCCGSGQATQFLVKLSQNVTGLDASPLSLKRARQNVPSASYVEAFAENMPFADGEFDVVHTSVALHEMEPQQLRQIISEVYRVLKPGGVFTLVDFHAPTNPIFWPGVSLFLLLFETETAWQLIKTDLPKLLTEIGFEVSKTTLYAGGSLQVIQAKKP